MLCFLTLEEKIIVFHPSCSLFITFLLIALRFKKKNTCAFTLEKRRYYLKNCISGSLNIYISLKGAIDCVLRTLLVIIIY